jgi:hypothetical protein
MTSASLVDSQFALSDAGILDMLCVDEDGLPVAVEVKLAQGGEGDSPRDAGNGRS